MQRCRGPASRRLETIRMSKEEERDYYVDACAERRAAARRVLRSTPRRSSDVLTGMGLAEIMAVYLEWEDLMALRALGLGAWRELSMEWMLKERRAPARIAVHAMRRLLKAVRRTAALVADDVAESYPEAHDQHGWGFGKVCLHVPGIKSPCHDRTISPFIISMNERGLLDARCAGPQADRDERLEWYEHWDVWAVLHDGVLNAPDASLLELVVRHVEVMAHTWSLFGVARCYEKPRRIRGRFFMNVRVRVPPPDNLGVRYLLHLRSDTNVALNVLCHLIESCLHRSKRSSLDIIRRRTR